MLVPKLALLFFYLSRHKHTYTPRKGLSQNGLKSEQPRDGKMILFLLLLFFFFLFVVLAFSAMNKWEWGGDAFLCVSPHSFWSPQQHFGWTVSVSLTCWSSSFSSASAFQGYYYYNHHHHTTFKGGTTHATFRVAKSRAAHNSLVGARCMFRLKQIRSHAQLMVTAQYVLSSKVHRSPFEFEGWPSFEWWLLHGR